MSSSMPQRIYSDSPNMVCTVNDATAYNTRLLQLLRIALPHENGKSKEKTQTAGGAV